MFKIFKGVLFQISLALFLRASLFLDVFHKTLSLNVFFLQGFLPTLKALPCKRGRHIIEGRQYRKDFLLVWCRRTFNFHSDQHHIDLKTVQKGHSGAEGHLTFVQTNINI